MTADEIKNVLDSKISQIRATALKVLQIEADKSIKLNFAAQGRPEHWRPKKRADGRPILTGKTGRLLIQTTSKIDEANNRVVIGNTLPYGRIHQEGGVINRQANPINNCTHALASNVNSQII